MKSSLTTYRMLPIAMLGVLSIIGRADAAAVTITNHSFESNRNYDQTLGGGGFARGESRDFGANNEVDTVQAGDANNITGWTTITTDNTNIAGAQIAVGFKDLTPADPTGTGSAPFPQALSLQAGASTGQVTSVAWSSLSIGDVITMTVAVGDRNQVGVTWADESFFGITDGLAAGRTLGNTVANSGLIATPPGEFDSGTMGDLLFNYNVTAFDLTRSGNVGILLVAFGDANSTGTGLSAAAFQAFFDNVRLDISSSIVIPAPAALPAGLAMLGLIATRRRC